MDDVRPQKLSGRLSRATRSLSFQLIALLSLAMLPIAVIAVWQSLSFAHESRRSAETLLLGLTAESVAVEMRLIEAGLRVDPSVIAVASLVGNNSAQCRSELAQFIAGQLVFQSGEFVSVDGTARCASNGQKRDLRNDPAHLRFLENPVPMVDQVARDDGGTARVLRVLHPVRADAKLVGYVSLVLQTFALPPVRNPSAIPNPTEVILFNTDGTVLTSTLQDQGVVDRLPSGADYDLLQDVPDGYFEQTDRNGTKPGFVKVTLIPGALFAIGIWPQDNPVSLTNHAWARAYGYPLLVWLFGIGAAWFAAERLVVRPVRMLRDEMRRFALGQRTAAMVLSPGAALEIHETVETFNKLELIVTRSEAALALTAEGKLLLLREMHHRIKNNLQMISSIISIQRRKTADPQISNILRSLQDRVLSVAAIDQSLYTHGDVSDVRADLLIASITNRLVNVNLEPGHGVQIAPRFAVVMLHADQIGPLTLLANEAVTNALKYVGKPAVGPPKIDIALGWQGDIVHFSVVNTTGNAVRGASGGLASTRIGMVLIRAFCDQLGAECHAGLDDADQRFHLSVKFRPNGLPMDLNPQRAAEDQHHAAIAEGIAL